MVDTERFAPSLFDKLTSHLTTHGAGTTTGNDGQSSGGPFRFFTVPSIDRYNARTVRSVLLRDLGWLFNTANLAATIDLAAFPEVRSSVINFGVADLAGKSSSRRVLEQRARDLRGAIRAFEPRLATDRLDVEVATTAERDDAVTFLVRSDVVSSLQPLPVEFKTDVEFETGVATVRA